MNAHRNDLVPLPQLTPGEALVPSEMRVAHLRGGVLETQDSVYESSLKYAKDPQAFAIGSAFFPPRALLEGISAEGSSGSGKSIYIRQIQRSLLHHASVSGDRLLIWDFKGRERQYIE